MAEKYKKNIADNPEVEFIHVSQDFEKAEAEKWAAAAQLPWLTVLPENYEKTGMLKFYTEAIMPFYTMVDSKGKEVANGEDAIFKKVAELAKEAE